MSNVYERKQRHIDGTAGLANSSPLQKNENKHPGDNRKKVPSRNERRCRAAETLERLERVKKVSVAKLLIQSSAASTHVCDHRSSNDVLTPTLQAVRAKTLPVIQGLIKNIEMGRETLEVS